MKQDNRYVVGFAFAPFLRGVLLIEKTHPEWQKGKWNGVGGHIEGDETPLEAMNREALEETGVTGDFGWEHYATMRGEDFECFVFAGRIAEPCRSYADSGERLLTHFLPLNKALPRIANLDFLIQAALVRNSFAHMLITYGPNGDSSQVK